MEQELVSLKDVLGGIFSRIEQNVKNEIALAPRDKRLPDQSIVRLREAIKHGWESKEICGPWRSGEFGYEPGEVLDIKYLANEKLTSEERIAIVNEARRGASKAAIAEHIAILAAHKRYTGADGFAFVMSDIIFHISHFSELAVRNAMEYLKMHDESPWFPPARDIVRQCEWEQKKIDRLSESVKTGKNIQSGIATFPPTTKEIP